MTDTPRVDACIETCMEQYPGESERASLRYFEAVHQDIAPLARQLERELANAKDVQRFMTDKCLEAQEIARLAQNEIIDLRSELAAERIKRECAERRLAEARKP